MRLGARFWRLAAGLFAVSLLLFVLPTRLAGGIETGFLGTRAGDQLARTQLRSELHLDRSAPVRFAHYLGDLADGNLGHSPVSDVDVGAVVGERLPATLALAAAAGLLAAALLSMRGPFRRRRRRRAAAAGGSAATIVSPPEPAPSAVPGALWVLPLFGAVAIAVRFGGIPAPAAHAAIVSRAGASLLPVAALGASLAIWMAAARRTRRDLIAAVIVGTLVTEAVFGLPGLGSLLSAAAGQPDPMMVRGVLLAVSAVAVVAGAVLLPFAAAAGDLSGGPSTRRRAARGGAAALWILALTAAVLGRTHLGLDPASRVGSFVGRGVTRAHPLGTDVLGRDVLSRTLATARGSLLLVVAAMLVALVLGTVVGVIVGFCGGPVERFGLFLLTGWAAFPGELVALAFLAFVGRDGKHAALALAMAAAPTIAFAGQRRTVDALTRSDGRLASGAWLRDVGSRASSGAVRAALATVFVGASRVVVVELVAGFLGLGPAATQTWSHEIALQLSDVSRAPLAVLVPALVALVTASALAALGNAIRPAR